MHVLDQKDLIHITLKMQTRGSIVCLQSLAAVFRMYKIQKTGDLKYYSLQRFSPVGNRFGRDDRMYQGLKLIGSVNLGDSRCFSVNRNMNESAKPPIPPPPPNPWFNFPGWVRWVLGSALSILLPFWSQKLRKLKRIEGEAEMVVEGAEIAAEMVEKVATATKKMSEEVAEKLPENSKLKETAIAVEHISAAAAHDAHVAKDFLQKIDELKQDLDELEEMVDD